MNSWLTLGQSFAQNQELKNRAQYLLYSDPDETIKIAQQLLKSNSSQTEKAGLYLLIAESSEINGDYNTGIKFVYKADNYRNNLSDALKIKILFLKAHLLNKLYLNSQVQKYLEEAEILIENLPENDQKNILKAELFIHTLERYNDHHKYKDALELVSQKNTFFKKIAKTDSVTFQKFTLLKAITFNNQAVYDSAAVYLNRAFQFLQNSKTPNKFQQTIIWSEWGKYYFHKKDYQKSIEFLQKALQEAQQIDNQQFLKTIYRQLIFNYLALNDKKKCQLYSNEFLKYHNALEIAEQEAVNNAYNLISQEQEDYFFNKNEQLSKSFYLILCISIGVVILIFIFLLKERTKRKRLLEINRYLEIRKNIFKEKSQPKKEVNKKINIPFETEQLILSKLKRFNASTKFTNSEMSLAVLAGQFETNTKYLSEIINRHYQDNFNTYINKLRINYIIEKLKTDYNYREYKISYLAEKSGFSSHSSFTTVFKSITGISPVTFIELLKNETNEKDKNQANEL